jgi:hypothetical protein
MCVKELKHMNGIEFAVSPQLLFLVEDDFSDFTGVPRKRLPPAF